jgi:hypothetical protein
MKRRLILVYPKEPHPSDFEVEGVRHVTAEQFMMAEPARLFRDSQSLEKILLESDPGKVKAVLGAVRGEEPKWRKPTEATPGMAATNTPLKKGTAFALTAAVLVRRLGGADPASAAAPDVLPRHLRAEEQPEVGRNDACTHRPRLGHRKPWQRGRRPRKSGLAWTGRNCISAPSARPGPVLPGYSSCSFLAADT